jgi:hypothetical protein
VADKKIDRNSKETQYRAGLGLPFGLHFAQTPKRLQIVNISVISGVVHSRNPQMTARPPLGQFVAKLTITREYRAINARRKSH